MTSNPRHGTARGLVASTGLLIAILLALPGVAPAQFVDATNGLPLGDTGNGQGVAWGDYDNDGDLDLYLANWASQNRLLRNDGAGTFVDVTATSGPLNDTGYSRAIAWGDYDNDGDLDLYLAKYNGEANRLFRNNGDGTFTDATGGTGLGDSGNGTGVAWGDYDNDGYLDLYLVNNGANRLFRNFGFDLFLDVTSGPLGDTGNARGVGWGDYDNDGDLDLYVANYGTANKLFRNDGGGTFVDATTSPLDDTGNGEGIAWGDYDNDGDLDLYLVNYGQPNKLFRNSGGGTFEDATSGVLADSTGNGRGAAWGDYDNDGDLDLYLSNYSGQANRLFRNNGDGTFEDATAPPLNDTGNGEGIAWGDYDNDGDLDLYLANDNGQPNRLFRNEAAAGRHWLQVKLQGTLSNRAGIGARVRVVSDGVGRIREISGGSGYRSQDAMVASFGLGSATVVDSLIVRWPSGIVQVVRPAPAVDGVVTVVEADFVDATTGPLADTGAGRGVAWGDYDNDGDLDLYLANRGTENKLFRNEGGSTFTDATGTGGLGDPGYGAGVAWGDYDNDGDLDLYLVNDGQANKLFRNDGNGTFADVTSGPLGDTETGNGVAWGDYDNDGDLDLFFVKWGEEKRLLRNDGGGVFTDVSWASGLGGMETSLGVAWGDYDNDGDLDLYIANWGGPNRLYRNNGNGTFADQPGAPYAESGYSTGVAWGDYDNDGDLDLYVASYGTSRLWRNLGGGSFMAYASNIDHTGDGRGVAWGDYDNDGDLDLYLVTRGEANKLFRNDGGDAFTDATNGPLGDTGNGMGVAWGDYDNDGDLDLYVANDGTANKLLRNEAAAGRHWLQVKLQGTLSNRSGIGARVRVVAGGVSRIREISGGSGYLSQDAVVASFGLGSATVVDSLIVRWPSGLVQDVIPPPAVDGVIAVVEGHAISTVSDVPGDQGGWARVGFSRHPNDRSGRPQPITSYYLWRRVDDASLAGAVRMAGTPLRSRVHGAAAPDGLDATAMDVVRYGDRLFVHSAPSVAAAGAGALPPGTWEVVGSVPAIQQPNYLVVSPTLADSSVAGGAFWSVFVVTAHTAVPTAWYASPPDSGCSLDNIAPGIPQGLVATYAPGTGVSLGWLASDAEDFQYFRIYRGATPDFVPAPGNLADSTAGLSWTDPVPLNGAVFYKVAAVDHAGNEGAPAASGSVTAADGVLPVTFALHRAVPNPSTGSTRIGFALPRQSGVRLELYDVAGRLVRTLVGRVYPAGIHRVEWDGRDARGRAVASGVYLYRMKAEGFEATRRVLVVR